MITAHTQVTEGFKGYQETPGSIPSRKTTFTYYKPHHKADQGSLVEETSFIQQYHDVGSLLHCLFGFMRISEFTVPSKTDYDKSCHLCLSDIVVDNRKNPHLLKETIKESKTDLFRKGVHIYLGATDRSICPILGILPYLAARGHTPGPLFITGMA